MLGQSAAQLGLVVLALLELVEDVADDDGWDSVGKVIHFSFIVVIVVWVYPTAAAIVVVVFQEIFICFFWILCVCIVDVQSGSIN